MLQRTKESFKEKIQSQSSGSQEVTLIAINNFGIFSMEKYGTVVLTLVKKLRDLFL